MLIASDEIGQLIIVSSGNLSESDLRFLIGASVFHSVRNAAQDELRSRGLLPEEIIQVIYLYSRVCCRVEIKICLN